jgi:hypothetical protein
MPAEYSTGIALATSKLLSKSIFYSVSLNLGVMGGVNIVPVCADNPASLSRVVADLFLRPRVSVRAGAAWASPCGSASVTVTPIAECETVRGLDAKIRSSPFLPNSTLIFPFPSMRDFYNGATTGPGNSLPTPEL